MPNSYYSCFIEMGNVVANSDTGCKIIELKRTKSRANQKSSDFLYTSKGIVKARPCDPIYKKEDIIKLKNYFLSHGSKEARMRNHAIFVVGISIGLRGSDLLALKIKDVFNVKTGEIYNKINVYEKKTGKINSPFLNEECRKSIKEYLDFRIAKHKNVQPDEYLFSNLKIKGDYITLSNLYSILKNACKDLELPYHIGTHTLRKTFGYWVRKQNIDNPDIMNLLQYMFNHSSQQITLRYIGVKDEEKCMAYKTIESIFDLNEDVVEEEYNNFSFLNEEDEDEE